MSDIKDLEARVAFLERALGATVASIALMADTGAAQGIEPLAAFMESCSQEEYALLLRTMPDASTRQGPVQ